MGSRGNVDIVEHVAAMDEKLANMRVALEDLTLVARDHDVRIDGTLARVGVVRFDAYQDLGGRQSAAVAFLNSLGNGVVITTVVSRDFARMYVKLLKDGVARHPSGSRGDGGRRAGARRRAFHHPSARGRYPGAARCRLLRSTPMPAALLAAGLPGRRPPSDRELARENRRRKRQGLPPVVETVTPSATGWEDPETPSPRADSLGGGVRAPAQGGEQAARPRNLGTVWRLTGRAIS